MSIGHGKYKLKMPSPYGLIPIFSLLLDVLLIYAWLIILTYWHGLGILKPPMNFISFLILAAGTYAVTRFLVMSRKSLKLVRLASVALAGILLLILFRSNLSGGYAWLDSSWFGYAINSLPAVVIGLAADIYLVWRGLSVSRETVKFDSLYRQFTIGLSAFILLLAVSSIARLDSRVIWSTVGLYSFIYFGVGLFALAMVNMESLQDKLLHHQEAVTAFRRRWLSMLVLLVSGILVTAIVLASLFNSGLATAITHALSTATQWLWDNSIYLFYPLGIIAQLLIFVGQFIINWLRGNQPVQDPQLSLGGWKDPLTSQGNPAIPDFIIIIITVFKWLLLAAVAGLIIYLLASSVRISRKSKSTEGIEEENESLWSWLTFKADLKNFWCWLFRWVVRRRPQSRMNTYTETPAVQKRTVDDRLYSVRELYRALLWQGRELGIPRRLEETPNEYRHRLEIRTGEVSQEIDQLTEAYIQERYGLTNTEPEQIKWLNRLWQSLRNKVSGK